MKRTSDSDSKLHLPAMGRAGWLLVAIWLVVVLALGAAVFSLEPGGAYQAVGEAAHPGQAETDAHASENRATQHSRTSRLAEKAGLPPSISN